MGTGGHEVNWQDGTPSEWIRLCSKRDCQTSQIMDGRNANGLGLNNGRRHSAEVKVRSCGSSVAPAKTATQFPNEQSSRSEKRESNLPSVMDTTRTTRPFERGPVSSIKQLANIQMSKKDQFNNWVTLTSLNDVAWATVNRCLKPPAEGKSRSRCRAEDAIECARNLKWDNQEQGTGLENDTTKL
ncbi:hypothetical protein BDV93DRAFT_514956 [Ceratobasidium sp. AG-I]|nr:hypothetical protein BDV93DRAFT_514956 [Ceratobasidium sp. AG-I]